MDGLDRMSNEARKFLPVIFLKKNWKGSVSSSMVGCGIKRSTERVLSEVLGSRFWAERIRKSMEKEEERVENMRYVLSSCNFRFSLSRPFS